MTGEYGSHGTAGYGAGSTNCGPHDSNIVTKLDPRVDSDPDHRGAATSAYGSSHTAGSGIYVFICILGQRHLRGRLLRLGLAHSSHVANKLDPRVDSDRDHRGAIATGTGLGSLGSTHSTNAGPHSSPNPSNKLDHRVDSDRNHRGAAAVGAFGTGNTAGSTDTRVHSGTRGLGTGTTSATGPRGSGLANKADLHVDSDRDYCGNIAVTSTNPGPRTAGRHRSDLLNKLDPRVDSDPDGSETFRGDESHARDYPTDRTHGTRY